tara:strand:+ start:68 stop:385 length:318 start_codon:yes stop_codon:yes gene_type:complete
MSEAKKVIFYSTDTTHADLKIRLHYDGISQSIFFKSLVEGYLRKDERILDFIDDLKEKLDIHSKKKRSDSGRLKKKGEEVKKQFALDENDIEDIFDILEEVNPEL